MTTPSSRCSSTGKPTSQLPSSNRYLTRPSPSGLSDVVDLILDRGLVIDAYVRVAVLGIELATIDARVVVASVDTYLRFADAVTRLDVAETQETPIEFARTAKPRAMTATAGGALDAVKEELIEAMEEDER
jgi:gas vesicle structural protein